MKSILILFTNALLALSLQAGAQGQATQSLTPEQSLAAKCEFLDCDLQSSQGLLDAGSAAICSENFELVKAKVFGGDFTKLMEFWQANKTKEAYETLCKTKK